MERILLITRVLLILNAGQRSLPACPSSAKDSVSAGRKGFELNKLILTCPLCGQINFWVFGEDKTGFYGNSFLQ